MASPSPQPPPSHEEVVKLVNERLDQAVDQTRDLVKVLKELLSVNLDRSGRFLLLHNEAGEEVGESARVAVGMTHGLVEACMQVSEDGNKMVEETKKKIEAIKKQVDLLESQLTKSGIL